MNKILKAIARLNQEVSLQQNPEISDIASEIIHHHDSYMISEESLRAIYGKYFEHLDKALPNDAKSKLSKELSLIQQKAKPVDPTAIPNQEKQYT